MGFYRIADRIFELKCKYDYTPKLCADYETSCKSSDYIISVTDEEISAEREGTLGGFSCGYFESLAIYRKITDSLISDDCFLMHAAVLAFDGKAYAFTAKSGTGKTTHIKLWKKVYGNRVSVINGDKPLIRREKRGDGYSFTVYGTPWSGKERFNINTSAPLCGICLVERGEINEIERIEGEEAVPKLLGQLRLRRDEEYLAQLLGLLDTLVTDVPIYRLRCNMSEDAARVACGKMVFNSSGE